MTRGVALMRDVEEIEAAFLKVRSSAEKAIGGDEATKDKSFQDVFVLNNAIGRLGRQRPKTMRRMKDLQACVNMITVAMKYGKVQELRDGISLTAESISAMKKEFSSAP